MLDMAKPLVCRLGEGHIGLDEARKRPPARFIEQVAQPSFGRAFGEVARRRTAAIGPCRADPALQLPSVGKPVLRIPLRSALALDPENVSRNGPRRSLSDRRHAPISGPISGHISVQPDSVIRQIWLFVGL
jgi:hypothetical protein